MFFNVCIGTTVDNSDKGYSIFYTERFFSDFIQGQIISSHFKRTLASRAKIPARQSE